MCLNFVYKSENFEQIELLYMSALDAGKVFFKNNCSAGWEFCAILLLFKLFLNSIAIVTFVLDKKHLTVDVKPVEFKCFFKKVILI